MIILGAHQRVQLLGVLELDPGQPAFGLGPLVDGRRLLFEHGIGLDNGARHWRHNVRRRLDRLDGANGVTRADLKIKRRELDKDNVAERVGCVGGYADCA